MDRRWWHLDFVVCMSFSYCVENMLGMRSVWDRGFLNGNRILLYSHFNFFEFALHPFPFMLGMASSLGRSKGAASSLGSESKSISTSPLLYFYRILASILLTNSSYSFTRNRHNMARLIRQLRYSVQLISRTGTQNQLQPTKARLRHHLPPEITHRAQHQRP